jgi:serine/threonine protein kinase
VQVDTIINNRYQIQSQLSNKAGRKTFLAQDLQSSRAVVMKILQFNTEFHWNDLKLFEREAATLQNLNHPAIPQYLDFFELPDGFALVQTYIDAPSLETVVKQGRKFSEAEVMELATRLLDILSYLHEQNPPVIHRDIKPSNILLANRSGHSIGDVYLVDFGSVQTVASKDGGTITIVGSYGYIPLEQFGGQTTVASDLYSLGMTLIYLLTGTHPADLPQVNGQVKFTAEISSNFRRWLNKITQPHLDKRFDSAKSAQIALTSKDGSYGDFTHLKPAHSQVQLYRDRGKLEIRCRAIQLGMNKKAIDKIRESQTAWTYLLGFIIAIPCLFCFLPLSIIYYSLIQPLMDLILGKKLIKYQLTIEKEYIHLSKYNWLTCKFKTLRKEPRDLIEFVLYNPGYVFSKQLDSRGRLMNGDKVSISPQLYILCGDVRYVFSDRLSQDELWWLGQELSDFLNLELQVIYPTPKVPSAPSCGGGC